MEITMSNIENVFVFDIETVPDQTKDPIGVMQLLRDKEDKSKGLGGRLVDPLKIEAAAADEFKKLALNAKMNQMCSFSYTTFKVNPQTQEIEMNTNVIFATDELSCISKSWEVIQDFYEQHNDIIFAGFGISYFDIPQIRSKIIRHNLPKRKNITKPILPSRKFDMIDLSEILGDGKLEEWLQFFKMEGKYNGIQGSQVQELYEKGDYETIKKYSLIDARREAELLLRTIFY